MNKEIVIRAWKDENFRSNLSKEQLDAMPEHPAGLVEITDTALSSVAGATYNPTCGMATLGCTQWPKCGGTSDCGCSSNPCMD